MTQLLKFALERLLVEAIPFPLLLLFSRQRFLQSAPRVVAREGEQRPPAERADAFPRKPSSHLAQERRRPHFTQPELERSGTAMGSA